MKKKRTKKMIIVAIIVLVLGYLTITPMGALRLSVAMTGITVGDPIHGFIVKIDNDDSYFEVKENQVVYRLENPPIESGTGELTNWLVTKHGIFYTAEYYGE
ncbi:hypothetical protein P261_00628 [Lachnospiraceae bacterium TWA4]|nr:hypothetical protein P261_00628 [Lachnospiraceae bacterium TWA4]